MTDYIEREAAKRKYCETCNWYGKDLCNGCETPMSKIPAADVAPVKHGRWSESILRSPDGSWKIRGFSCSVCGGLCIGESNYCPNCGAKMDGGKNV